MTEISIFPRRRNTKPISVCMHSKEFLFLFCSVFVVVFLSFVLALKGLSLASSTTEQYTENVFCKKI